MPVLDCLAGFDPVTHFDKEACWRNGVILTAMATEEEQAVESLFDSNSLPSSRQHSITQAAIESLNQKLTAVDQRIAHLTTIAHEVTAEMGELEADKVAIEMQRKKYMDVVSARRQIPTEVVSAFIDLACPNSPTSLDGTPPFIPFLLVSRGWFRAVCEISRFWSELDIDLMSPGIEEAHFRRVVQKARRWYSRAGCLPLTLSLSLSSYNPLNYIFIEYLHSTAGRVGSFLITVELAAPSEFALLPQVFRDIDSANGIIAWPQMKKLHLSIQLKSNYQEEIQLPDIFPCALKQFPILQDFAIRSNGTIARFDISWVALTKLHLGPFSVRGGRGITYCSILGSCQNLRVLHVGIDPQVGVDSRVAIRDWAELNLNITLPHLERLSVEHGFGCETPCADFLGTLVLPSLQSFSIKYTSRRSTSPFSYFPAALTKPVTRSQISGTLKSVSLSLDNALMHISWDLRAFLSEVQALEFLKLSGNKINLDFIRLLPASLKQLTLELSPETRLALQQYLNEHPTTARVCIM